MYTAGACICLGSSAKGAVLEDEELDVGPVVADLVWSRTGGDGLGCCSVVGCRCAVVVRMPLVLCVAGGGGLFAAGPDSSGAVVG